MDMCGDGTLVHTKSGVWVGNCSVSHNLADGCFAEQMRPLLAPVLACARAGWQWVCKLAGAEHLCLMETMQPAM
jgi:hypothetical protein